MIVIMIIVIDDDYDDDYHHLNKFIFSYLSLTYFFSFFSVDI